MHAESGAKIKLRVLADNSSVGYPVWGDSGVTCGHLLSKTWTVRLCIWNIGCENPSQDGVQYKARSRQNGEDPWSGIVAGLCPMLVLSSDEQTPGGRGRACW